MKKLLIFCLAVGFVFAIANTGMAAKWNIPGNFGTIQEAIDSSTVSAGDTIFVGAGNHVGATVTKAVEIKGQDGAVIYDGPLLSASMPCETIVLNIGFYFESGGAGSGATISHLKFEGPAFPVYSGGADDVTVTHCTMINPIQGVSDWGGSGWEISHNVITDLRSANGGGIGIIVADRLGGIVENNVVSHNKITGTLHVSSCDEGGYDGSGIVIYADFRGGGAGANEISNNRVVKNKISFVSNDEELVGAVAFELTDTRNDVDADPYPVVFNNAIGFNDFRGTTTQIVLTPEALDECNDISRNHGDNRGHGDHPSVFGPGGN